MKIAIVAATALEIEPFIAHLDENSGRPGISRYRVMITGIGLMSATYHLTNLLQTERPDCIIQAGVAGSFSHSLPPGELVMVKEECLGDLGVEENKDFIDGFDMGLMHASALPFHEKKLVNPGIAAWDRFLIPAVNGVTVNEITTRPDRIRLLRNKYDCQVETMEGAALHYTCLMQNVPFIQLRAVSNRVGERDKKNWRLAQAIQTLNDKLIEIIREL